MPTIFQFSQHSKGRNFLGPGEELAPLESSLGASGLSPELFTKKEHSLGIDTTKLIIYSTRGSRLLMKWLTCGGEVIVEERWEIHSGMNVLCLCIRKLPESVSHAQIAADNTTDTLTPLTTPDLDIKWQSFVLADECPVPLSTMAGVKLGFSILRQERAVQRALQDESVNHVMTTNKALMEKIKLSKAQKVLLRLDVRPSVCTKLNFGLRTYGGHNKKALDSRRELHDVFDYELASSRMDWDDRFMALWLALDEDTYWNEK